MSYVPLRYPIPDNPDLTGLPEDIYERLVPLGDLIEASHLEGYHQSECGCTKPTCWTREHHYGPPSTEEVLGWLVAKGLLNLNAASRIASGPKAGPDPLAAYAETLIRNAATNVDAMTVQDLDTEELGRKLTDTEVDQVLDLIRQADVVVVMPPAPAAAPQAGR